MPNKTLIILLLFCFSISGQIPKSAYVVNTLGENLTIIDLQNHTVSGISVPLGLYANSVKIRDNKAYSVISGSNEIHVLDLTNQTISGRIQLPPGSNPYDIEFVSDSIAAVTLLITNQIAFVNVNSGVVIRTVPAGVAPQGLKYHDQHVYVANSGFNGAGYDPGKISVVSVNDYTIDEISVGTNPQSLDFDSQGNLIVACSGNYTTIPAQLDIIDAGSSSVSFTQSLPIPVTNIFVSPEDRAYLATYTDGVMVYNLTDRQFLRDNSNSLPGGPGVAFDAQNNIYVCHFDLDSLYVYSPDLEKLEAYLVGDGPVSVAVYDPFPTGIDIGKPEFPGDFHLYPNFPNPFNPKTSVRFQISTMSDIFVDIINLRGQQVKTLLEGCVKPGTYTIKWDGTNDHEAPVASGVYLLRLSNGNQQQVQKIQLVR